MNQLPVTVPLDINGLRNYKRQNPVKFKDKFGDLDLDNLPEGFDIQAHKAQILAGKPKTPIIQSVGARPNPTAPVNQESTNVDGGNTLKDNENEVE